VSKYTIRSEPGGTEMEWGPSASWLCWWY
jgi:hypothetical protein